MQFFARQPVLTTVLLLLCSNLFMTIAWYGHLKYTKSPLVIAILASWGIALAEYCFQVPANRIGYTALSLFPIKGAAGGHNTDRLYGVRICLV